MKLRAHDVVTMSGDDVDASSALIVPDPHSLIVAGRQYPRQLMVEEGSTNVINMPFEREQASFLLVVPYFNKTIISTWNKQRQLWVKIDSSGGSFVALDKI